jgi:hypothetical protein
MGDSMTVRITSLRVHGLTFFEHRRLFAFTSMSPRVYNEILRRGVYTVELHSAHNINALLSTQDNTVFITDRAKEDMKVGVRGIVADIKSVSIMEHKTPERDESEIVEARVQIEPRGLAKARQLIDHGIGKPLEVVVEEVVACSAS